LIGSSPRTAWSRRSRASQSDPDVAAADRSPGLGELAGLYGAALARLRGSAHLRRSLLFWTVLGLVLGEALTADVTLVHGNGTLTLGLLATAVWWSAVTIGVIGGAALLQTPDGTPVDRYGIPNGLTALRGYACVPLLFIATLSLPGRLALALWAGIGGSVGLLDAVDGFIARRYGPITVLGKAMDPFGDALYFVVGAIGCETLGIAPLWLAVLIVARYAGPVLLTPLVLLTGRRPELVHTVWGRRNTILTGSVLFVLFWVRLFGGPVDIIALIIGIPTLVPTALVHFAALFQRVAASPRAR
jgi:phosphatidylglycerophosphate synthase